MTTTRAKPSTSVSGSVMKEAVRVGKQPHTNNVSHPSLRAGAMPDTRDVNFYEADPYLRFVLRRRLSPDEFTHGEEQLWALGARLGGEIEELAAEADRNTPTLQVRDKRGEPVNDVVPSRAYRELERVLYGEFALAAMSLRANPSSLLLNDALIY